MKTTIKAEIVAHSKNEQGDELISILATFPRIILAEVNTHRMLSKNTSSSRAIPFNKMVESIQNDPFIPIAWQKAHSGMQGTEYETEAYYLEQNEMFWLRSRDFAVSQAIILSETNKVTKQLCNRLLEPFMWTTMLITGSREGWDNFFNLRCPQYRPVLNTTETFKSRKDAIKRFSHLEQDNTELLWLLQNKGQAEIHMMALAESIYDAVNESTPIRLQPGEWHIPFEDKMTQPFTITEETEFGKVTWTPLPGFDNGAEKWLNLQKVKVSVAMAARTSYTVVGEEKVIDYEAMIGLHDRLLAQDPPHSSPMEHCSLCVSQEKYDISFKGQEKGWFRNYRGFKSYRQIIEESK